MAILLESYHKFIFVIIDKDLIVWKTLIIITFETIFTPPPLTPLSKVSFHIVFNDALKDGSDP